MTTHAIITGPRRGDTSFLAARKEWVLVGVRFLNKPLLRKRIGRISQRAGTVWRRSK